MKYQGLHVHVHVLQVSLCSLSLVSRYFLVSLMLTFPHIQTLDIRRSLVFSAGRGSFTLVSRDRNSYMPSGQTAKSAIAEHAWIEDRPINWDGTKILQ